MRIEDVSAENVRLLADSELRHLAMRADQTCVSSGLWQAKLRKLQMGIDDPVPRNDLLEAYAVLEREAERRGLDLRAGNMSRKLAAHRIRRLDVADLPPVVVKEGVVAVGGPFLDRPPDAKAADVYLDADPFGEDQFTFDLEKRLAELLQTNTGKAISVHRDPDGLAGECVPAYDLVLVPRAETRAEDAAGLRERLEARYDEIDDGQGPPEAPRGSPLCGEGAGDGRADAPVLEYVQKPYPNEHAAPQDSGPFDDYRRENDHFGSGIHVIWGIKGGKSKIASVRFDSSKFSVAQAKEWLKDHDLKTTVEPAKKRGGPNPFIKSEEERIVGGVVYSASDEQDSQGDFAEADDIYAAMKSWMLRGHPMRFMHDGGEVETPLVECFFAEQDTTKRGKVIPAGTWYISNHIPPAAEDLWKAIKRGDIRGYSMGGRSRGKEE